MVRLFTDDRATRSAPSRIRAWARTTSRARSALPDLARQFRLVGSDPGNAGRLPPMPGKPLARRITRRMSPSAQVRAPRRIAEEIVKGGHGGLRCEFCRGDSVSRMGGASKERERASYGDHLVKIGLPALVIRHGQPSSRA